MHPILKEYDFKTRMLFRVVYVFVRMLHATYRYRVFHPEFRVEASKHHPKGAFAFATWHGNSLAGTIAHAHQPFSPLCSQSKDGTMVAYLCDKLGLKPARGSSSRGGKEARQELLENMQNGYSTAITVDGPKGPPHITKSGIISIAKNSGCKIVPLAGIGENNWRLGSWDKLRIPKPFSKVAIIYAEAIEVPVDAEGEAFVQYQDRVTEALTILEENYKTYFLKWDTGVNMSQFRD